MRASFPNLLITLTMFLACAGHAQNLLINGDFSAGNVGFSTGYTYVASGISQNPGSCGIRTNSQDFNPNYTQFYDHTTNNGNMLLLDGAPGTDVIGWSETVAVMTNAQYSFSGWVTASDPYNVPTLRFSINGVQAGPEVTVFTNAGQWQQFVTIWNSGANTSATLSVVDDNPMGYAYGNDFALDDFSFSLALPSLSIALAGSNSVVISWPSPSTGFVLQQNTNLTSTNWATPSYLTNDNGTTRSVSNSVSGAAQTFYRLLQLP